MRTLLSKRLSTVALLALSASFALAAVGVPSSLAADGRNHAELGVQGGVFLPDRVLSGKPEVFDNVEPLYGIRAGYLFSGHAGWFIDASRASFNTNQTPAGDLDIQGVRTGIEFFSRKHWTKSHWFFAAGYGLVEYEPEFEPKFDRGFVSASLGHRWALDHRARLRWELRGDRTVDDDGLDGESVSTLQYLIAITWGIGVERPDSDGDGVPDGRDDCPDTPRGATVDARGCPIDSDGDGVYDGIDQCPDTPRGATVDARGCPIDSDGDGVYDGIDQCPDTPRGATVDARGCPSDSDGDGVYDGIDQCPDTPRGAIVDARGCPLDGDGDGVYDGIDQCPNTPPGTPVRPDGCPRAAALFEPERETLVLEGVFFELNKAVLTANSRTTLEAVALSLVDWPEISIEIGGHTDSTGTDAYNMGLSTRRAEAVRVFLLEHGVSGDRIRTRGYGESQPVADNTTEAGRAKNRRVELKKLN